MSTTKKAHIEMYKDAAGEWRWRVRAANGEIIGESEEGYVNHSYCARVAVERNPGLNVVER